MNRIKITYLVSSLVNEGPVNVLYNIIKHIDFKKFDVSVITLIPEKKNTRIDDFSNFPIFIKQIAPIKNKNPFLLYLHLKFPNKTLCCNPGYICAVYAFLYFFERKLININDLAQCACIISGFIVFIVLFKCKYNKNSSN